MTTHKLHIDFETKSKVDLRETGVYVYAASSTTDVWCAAYAVDDGEVKLWKPDDPTPPEIVQAIAERSPIVAHNAAFERAIWRQIMGPRYGWPQPTITQWRCTMAMALAMSLPASLDNASAAVGMPFGKDAGGHRLMMQMASPRRARKGELPNGTYWFDDEERRQRLYAYCIQDVKVERELEKRLMPLRQSEQMIWWLDQSINDRGVYVDQELALAALRIVEKAKGWLDDEMRAVTNGAVSACSNVGELTGWLRDRQGVETTSVAAPVIDELLLSKTLSSEARRALELRREAAKAAVSKIDALLAGRNEDGRARGLLQYHAAGPGRWGGRRFQPHNIKRPDIEDEDKMAALIEAVRTGDAEMGQMLYGNPLAAVADTLRGLIRAAPGNKIIAADLKNIEGRVTAWVAGEHWKLDAFRAFDAGRGHDIYHLTAGKILGQDPGSISKSDRQAYGKVPELALGFQGGVVAFQKMAVNYDVEMSDERAEEIKIGWREAHPATMQCWYDLENAAVRAIQNPGKIIHCGKVKFRTAGSFLFLQLPSGRCIVYPYPRVVDKMTPWGKLKPTTCFKGIDTFTRKWGDCYAYGGMWMQNIAEGIARDVLAEGMVRVERHRYPVILTVHDEIVAEPRADFGSLEEFTRLMIEPPTWSTGLPIAAGGFEAERYRK